MRVVFGSILTFSLWAYSGELCRAYFPKARTLNRDQIVDLHFEIAEKLRKKGIHFLISSIPKKISDEAGLSWAYFIIRPDGNHALNKLAKAVKDESGTVVIYDPISQIILGQSGVPIPRVKALYLNEDALKSAEN